jgi:hypothetical protein
MINLRSGLSRRRVVSEVAWLGSDKRGGPRLEVGRWWQVGALQELQEVK